MKFDSLINLNLTQYSGQTSRPPWNFNNGYFEEVIYLNEVNYDGSILSNVPVLLRISQDENNIDSFNCIYELPEKFSYLNVESQIRSNISRIFDLDFNLEKFYKYLANDERLISTIDFCKGLRLFIANNPFECIISSICSANNSIARWTKSISTIKSKWGNPTNFSSRTFYSFPEISKFNEIFEDENQEFNSNQNLKIDDCTNNLKSCGVGYRAPYMKKTSELFTLEIDVSEISKMSYDEAFETILKLPGVGPKVADCILLYGFNFKEAFPTDVWIKRIISYLYFDGEDISVKKIRQFGIDEFGDYAGYVQLYLFHYARKSGLMDKLKKK